MSDDEPQDEPSPVFPERGPNREGMVSDYLPESDDWEAKTNVDINDPAAIAALKEMGRMYPEVDDLQPLIDEFLHHFLKSKTSIKGQSREEYRKIFMSMYGASDGDDGDGTVAKLVAADDDE